MTTFLCCSRKFPKDYPINNLDVEVNQCLMFLVPLRILFNQIKSLSSSAGLDWLELKRSTQTNTFWDQNESTNIRTISNVNSSKTEYKS